MAPTPPNSCSVRQSTWDPCVWIFDFDPASPGGRGGASVYLDRTTGTVSIAGVHRNAKLSRRSTGALLAAGLRQTPMPTPRIIEANNVEKTTRAALAAGGDGQGTKLGNLLVDMVAALGGTITLWEPIPDGTAYHLRVHISYP